MAKIKNLGFTLIELLVVIAIIGLLSVMAVVAVNSARVKAANAKRIQTVEQYYKALSLYYAKEKKYPVPEGAAGTDYQANTDPIIGTVRYVCLGDYAGSGINNDKCWAGSLVSNAAFEAEVDDYIPDLPRDTIYCNNANRYNYRYGVPEGNNQSFIIWFYLKSTDPALCGVLGVGKYLQLSGTDCEVCYLQSQ